jgi:short-subunit dehydrogenase
MSSGTVSSRGTAVVTGASAGIGTDYARRLAADGYDLVLVARRAERLERFRVELHATTGVSIEPLVADLGRADDLSRVISRVAADDVSLLVNNAGISGYAPLHEADPAVLHAVLQLNVVAPTLLTRAALPGMLRRDSDGEGRPGAIINVASLLAFAGALPPGPLPERATYGGSKGYLVTFTRTLAAEVAGSAVRVQVVCPGLTATEFHLTRTADPVADDAAAAKPDEPHAMASADVVTASLAGLERGEVLCIPGLDDVTAIDDLAEVEARLRAGSRPRLAQRYLD